MTTRVPVRLPGALRERAGGAARVTVVLPGGGSPTVGAVLDGLARDHPGVGWRIRDERGGLRPHVNVFVGEDSIRDLGGLDATVPPGTQLTVLPAVSGGCR